MAQRVSVAIVSDTHGVLDARIAAAVERCDCAVHAGDIGSADTLQALRPRTGRVAAVLGNNDVPAKWAAAELHILAGLPWEARLELPGGTLMVVHGHQYTGPLHSRHAWLRRRYPQARLVVYGHSHRRVLDASERPWIINPGAAGRARTYGGPSFAVLTATRGDWSIAEHRFAPLR